MINQNEWLGANSESPVIMGSALHRLVRIHRRSNRCKNKNHGPFSPLRTVVIAARELVTHTQGNSHRLCDGPHFEPCDSHAADHFNSSEVPRPFSEASLAGMDSPDHWEHLQLFRSRSEAL
jgi:hypothetical protein